MLDVRLMPLVELAKSNPTDSRRAASTCGQYGISPSHLLDEDGTRGLDREFGSDVEQLLGDDDDRQDNSDEHGTRRD